MKIVVLANESIKEELLAQGLQENVQVDWISDPAHFNDHLHADAFMYLLPADDSTGVLHSITAKPVIINDVTGTLSGLHSNIIRINGWDSFLKRPVVEAACTDKAIASLASAVFAAFSKKTEWTPDIPGFIAARVVSMIINEAYFTLEEGVSTREEIDTAMKLGTNYPYGPFEWSRKIGIKNIVALLTTLAKTNKRYEPAAMLKKEATD
jgi:3-hydroxybutyryl-CoA dehydrogenase